MSTYAIQQYHRELEKIIHYGGTKKETAIRNAFYNLLNDYAYSKDLMLIAEVSTKNKVGKIITPDGTIKDSIRNDWGYWESKDETDDINEEIRKKFSKGYPSDNILFEDSQTAVLYQHGEEVMRKDMRDEEELHKVLTQFLSYERPEVHDFREAIEHFKQDIPKVTAAIRDIIDKQFSTSLRGTKQSPELDDVVEIASQARNDASAHPFTTAFNSFLEMAKASINPDITGDDIKEMMIQHILSADIFNTIFDEPHFHQENNIARELNRVIETFFTGQVRRQTLGSIKHYYDTINARAASIADHHEKQKFLKVVYENFYKGYNPKAADRLGIVYTPNEIVQFMIRSTDYLLHKHFGKTLGDRNVEILDPATGTGTFITDIIDYLPKGKLKHKYKHELHANELAILPYYIANLNIEYTYKQKMGEYEQFDNLCFVDTLDKSSSHFVQSGLFSSISTENATRIRRQNERKISVVIGNPPYNANQQNENDNNKNRTYTEIDRRIKETYIKNSTAQKTKLYDMYSRFYRWAMDRLNENGVIAFITNRSFIDSRTFDGFRKIVQQEFDHAYIIDTKSDVRANPKIAGTTHNVFGIQAGVAVLFLVKSSHKKIKTDPCKIEYVALEDNWRKEQKLAWFSENELKQVEFENVVPDKNNNWINLSDNNWESLLPVCSKDVKLGKAKKAIFELFSLGVVTARDEWVYGNSIDDVEQTTMFLVDAYNLDVEKHFGKTEAGKVKDHLNYSIKWTRAVKNDLSKGKRYRYNKQNIVDALYRPFVKRKLYYSKELNEMQYQMPLIFGKDGKAKNKAIIFTDASSGKPFMMGSTEIVGDLHFVGAGCGSEFLPLYRYSNDSANDNITDWAVEEFRNRYCPEAPPSEGLGRLDIFHYVYAVLHNPAYRKKYELNLKREFPRIPFYDNFWQWVKWGEQLMNLHINYETVEPYNLKRVDKNTPVTLSPSKGDDVSTAAQSLRQAQTDRPPKAKLKALKDTGVIQLDENAELHGIPPAAWTYKLGNRSALEWILDQYKEKKPSDPTIAEKFNTYKFADYKEQVIDLLKRVCTVSVETMKIVGEMEALDINNNNQNQ